MLTDLDGGADPAWNTYLFVHVADRALLGLGGFKGPPADGTVEIGYGIAPEYRHQGYATEGAELLIEIARAAGVTTVIAHTLPEPNFSTRVLAQLGFTQTSTDARPGRGRRLALGAPAHGLSIVAKRRPVANSESVRVRLSSRFASISSAEVERDDRVRDVAGFEQRRERRVDELRAATTSSVNCTHGSILATISWRSSGKRGARGHELGEHLDVPGVEVLGVDRGRDLEQIRRRCSTRRDRVRGSASMRCSLVASSAASRSSFTDPKW